MNLFKLMALVGILVILSVPLIGADERTCIDGILYKISKIYINESSSDSVILKTITMNQTEICPLGCSMNGIECNSPQNVHAEIYISIVFTLIILAFIFGYFSIKMSENHGALSLLFMACSLILAMTCIAILMDFNTQTQDSLSFILTMVFFLLLVVIIIFIFYVIINLASDVITRALKTKKQKHRR